MLSALRRALGQSSRSACRSLTTAASPESLSIPSVVAHDVALTPTQIAETRLSNVTPFNPPVYITLSSLLKPEEDSHSPANSVVELDPTVFSHPIRRDILHLCVVHHLDSLRQGSASTKTRGDVRGSGRKIRPQKGTGNARLGDGQSPMLRGGGVAFGPHPRDFSTKLNRKVIQMGMRVALSARVKENSLGIVESLEWSSAKTRNLAERIQELGWEKTLFVSGHEAVPDGLKRASSNIYKVETTTAKDLKVYDAVKWPRLVLDLAAVEWFERTLAKPVVPPRSYTF
ncbi:hypothetical protein IEO21_00109 [Rhodonia placenta]|uniref:Large ribosomal subunit protein uL4m n=1 Tax=Rhodonia placenta TaxID=104341 RepID=A0A8H7PC50_9APHY|nr:hypothetical protein IEO21_00109 [Postia placenta]